MDKLRRAVWLGIYESNHTGNQTPASMCGSNISSLDTMMGCRVELVLILALGLLVAGALTALIPTPESSTHPDQLIPLHLILNHAVFANSQEMTDGLTVVPKTLKLDELPLQ